MKTNYGAAAVLQSRHDDILNERSLREREKTMETEIRRSLGWGRVRKNKEPNVTPGFSLDAGIYS